MSEVGSTFVTVVPSAKGFGSKLNSQVGGEVSKSGKTIGQKFGGAVGKFAKVGLLAGGVAIGAFLKSAVGEAREAQKVGALTNAVIKSTGGVANVTAKDVDRLSTSLSKKIGVDDEAIASGQNMLLTFSNVRNEIGKGNKIFDRATVSASDMAAAFGGDAVSNSKMLGKALNDPIKGVSALTRVGVSFTQGQKDQIKAMQESGNLLGAQKIILGEVAKQTKGAAEAQVTGADKARVAWGNLQETVGTGLLPVIDKVANVFTTKVAPAVTKFVTGMQDGTGAGGEFAATVGDIVSTGSKVVGFFTSLPGPVKKYGAELLIAVAVMSKLRALVGPTVGSLSSFATGMAGAETRAKTLSSAMGKARVGASNLAGAAGLGLIVMGAQQSNKSIGTLMTTLGGAATGFALGGPIGAAVGGLAGLTYGLATSTKKAGREASASIGSWKEYAATLDSVTGKITAQTRAQAFDRLSKAGLFKITSSYGWSQRQVTDAITKGGPARDRMVKSLEDEKYWTAQTANALIAKHGYSGQETKDYFKAMGPRQRAIQALLDEFGAVGKATAAMQEKIAATRTYSAALKTLPAKVQTEIKEKGLLPTRAAVVDLTRKFNLVPKDVRTLIKENGGKPTKAMVDSIITAAKNLDKQHPTPRVDVANFRGVMGNIASINHALDVAARDRKTLIRVSHQQVGTGAGGSGALAKGGPVNAGRTYLVGERGPELFTANQSGRITPNNKLPTSAATGAAGGATITVYDRSGDPIRTAHETARQLAFAGGA